MSHLQLRIVFTGGPGAGKTSCLRFAKHYFERQNLSFLKIPEIPTIVFQTGIDFPNDDLVHKQFQKNLLKIQMIIENTVFSSMANDVICVCDRGLMDFKGFLLTYFLIDYLAYTKLSDWESILDELSVKEEDLFARYDAVIYFETSALRDPKLYVLNEARQKATPTFQDAIEQDRRTKAAWSKHPNFFTITATQDFDEKVHALVTLLDSLKNRPLLKAPFFYDDAKETPLKIKKAHPLAKMPNYMSDGAAGLDLYSIEECIVPAHGKRNVLTGICIEIPKGCYGRVAPRSGLALTNFIDVGAGVIDSDFRGEIRVLLYNFSDEDYLVKKGTRIAQLICEKICRPPIQETEELSQTSRALGCFGSTGI